MNINEFKPRCYILVWFWFVIKSNTLMLYLVLRKYKKKKQKNVKENDFLIFGYLVKYFKENEI